MRTTGTPLERALTRLLADSVHAVPEQLPAIVRAAGAELGATDVRLHLVDLDQLELVEVGGSGALGVDTTVAGSAFREERAAWDGARLWLPVLDSAERMGVVEVVLPEGDPGVEQAWATFASLVGELVVAKDRYGDELVRARRRHAVSLATEVRWGMLPPLTFTSPAITITGILEPAYGIAGDTFDYAVTTRQADIGLFDALGHGPEASRMAALAQFAYRNRRRMGGGIVELAQGIGDVIFDEFGDFRFVTAQLCRIDLQRGEVELVNAGHPPAVVLRANGDDEELGHASRPPLGLEGPRGEVVRTQLHDGDLLLLHTDGATEARDPAGTSFGLARLVARVRAAHAAGHRPAEVLRLVRAEVLRHERPLRDDATLVLVVWRPGEQATPPALRPSPSNGDRTAGPGGRP